MGRLRRFGDHRFVGTRDDMIVHDCDEGDELVLLEERVKSENLLRRNLLQGFAPDALPEARNRGFRPS